MHQPQWQVATDLLFLLKEIIVLPICREGKTSHPPLLKPLPLLCFRWKKQAIYFGIEEMNVTIGIGEATFWQTTCFNAFLHSPFQCSPWWCLSLCNVPPQTAVDCSPKGEIHTGFASNRWSCWAVLHPNVLKAPDRCGLEPSNDLNGHDFTSPSLCGCFHAPFLTLGNTWGQP